METRKKFIADQRELEVLLRFFSSVKKETGTGCWLWTRKLDPRGYGVFSLRQRSMGAHRVSMYLFKEFDLKSDLVIRHQCDSRNCVNPFHLEPGTHLDNSTDYSKKYQSKRKRYSYKKLNRDDVMRIRNLWRRGMSAGLISKKMGISTSHVHRVASKKQWKD